MSEQSQFQDPEMARLEAEMERCRAVVAAQMQREFEEKKARLVAQRAEEEQKRREAEE